MKTKTTTNPAFYADALELEPGDASRRERALHDPRSVDLLTWNVFASLDSHRDREWLGHRLQLLGGPGLRAPVRLTLWCGRDREPLLTPNAGYLDTVRDRVRRAGADEEQVAEAVREFAAPAEAAVRIESPGVLCLVATFLDGYPAGTGGRDRLLELVDAGIDAARRVGKELTVAVVYPSGTQAGGEISARVRRLKDPAALRAELPHRDGVPAVGLREVSWQQLLKVWETERDWLDLAGQPVKSFLAHCEALGLR